MGYSFGAATTDGVGSNQFEQATISGNTLWNTVRNLIVAPTNEDIDCQSPKPILLATGRVTFPYEWQPKIVAAQILQIGNFLIAAVPGEFSTMAGRRLRNQIEETANELGIEKPHSVIAGLSNVYSSYVTTPEEYQAQRFEAALTYGPHTLTIYLDAYRKLTTALLRNEKLSPGPNPPSMNNLLSLVTGVVRDDHPSGKDFGYVLAQPKSTYNIGEIVEVTFQAVNPRNNVMHNGTYLTVERQSTDDPNVWIETQNDASWDTKFVWTRTNSFWGYSEVTIYWTIADDTLFENYRISHFGHYKYIFSGIGPCMGTTNVFQVISQENS